MRPRASASDNNIRRLATASSVAAGWFASATPALADALDASLPALDASSPYVTAAALAAAALVGVGVKSAVGGSVGGGASGPAPALPRATPDTRGTGESDDSEGRRYLIAPLRSSPSSPPSRVRPTATRLTPGGCGSSSRSRASASPQRLRQRPHDGDQAQVRRPLDPRPRRPHRRVHRSPPRARRPVEHIVLPTTLFEHKIFVGPFQRRFPDASVWIAPDQWSWPVNLPPQFFGIFKTGTLGEDTAPWEDEFETELLQPPALGVASYVSFTECAFLHKPTKTLLVTDAVVYVSENIPDAIPDRDLDESGDDGNFTIAALKFLNLFDIATKAKSRTRTSADMTLDERRRLGWQRNALQALYFGPSNLLDPEESWRSITDRLIVAPVVSTLVYENIPREVNEDGRDASGGGSSTGSSRVTSTRPSERDRGNGTRRLGFCRRRGRKRRGEAGVRIIPTRTWCCCAEWRIFCRDPA